MPYKKTDPIEGNTREESLSMQLQQMLERDKQMSERDVARDKDMQEMRSIVNFLLEQKQEAETPSPKKDSPSKLFAPQSPPGSEKSVILANAPPPFNRTLKDLVSPYEYWTFIKSYKEYKTKYPEVAHTVHLIQYVATDILNGPLNLTEEIAAAPGSLLSDERIYRAVSAYFSLTHTTQRQFLDLVQKIPFEPAPYDKRSINAMQASQPLFSYLANVTHLYALLREMLPGAVPREEEFDRAARTTVKHIVNSHITKWWPWWATDIWPAYARSKERYWTDIATGISDKCRALVATFYPVQPLMETLNAFGTGILTHKASTPTDTKPVSRSLWQPNYKRESPVARPQPPAARVHMLDEASDLDEDVLDAPFIPEDGNLTPADDGLLHAITDGSIDKNICFAKLIKGTCTKEDCQHKHDKASMDAMARTILARPN